MIDISKVYVKAGDGGDGLVHYKRIKYNAFAGPDGGDGGNGGSVYIKANSKIRTLYDFKRQKSYKAENGKVGLSNFKSGRSSTDLYLNVPIGTLIYDVSGKKKKLLGDLTSEGSFIKIAKGGIGGYGNAHFKSSTNKTPDKNTLGTRGEEKQLLLELKVLSDIGLIGFPSVGKSTLINTLTQSSYKTAAYPFTTLEPNLGVLRFDDSRTLIIADLPGLIEGASEGKGLGDDFLRHTERCGMLVHLVDLTMVPAFNTTNRDINEIVSQSYANYNIIRAELSKWNANLSKKEEVIVFSKYDILSESLDVIGLNLVLKNTYVDKVLFSISAYTEDGLSDLISYLDVNYDVIVSNSRTLGNRNAGNAKYKLFDVNSVLNKRILFRS